MTAPSAFPPLCPTATPASVGSSQLLSALSGLRNLLGAPISLVDAAQRHDIQAGRLAIALILEQIDHAPPRGPLTDALLAAAEALLDHPAASLPVDESSRETVLRFISTGSTGSLARLFATPAWQNPHLRALGDQAPWLWATYARYLFSAPPFFQTREHEALWATHLLAHLEPLTRMLENNRGSAAVKTAAQIATALAPLWPVVGTPEQFRRRQYCVGRLLTLLAPRPAPFQPPQNVPAGQPLRVGLICENLSDGLGIYSVSRLKTLLDPERFDLTGYVLAAGDDFPPPHVQILPAAIVDQVETLRAARLDAVLFAGDLTRLSGPLAALALFRVALCQFATALCPHTSGLPEIDVFLADAAAAPGSYTERLALLPAALAFDPPAEPEAGETTPTREDFGLPKDARLLVATAHPAHVGAATRDYWRQVLDEDPSSQLIVLPGTSGPALDGLLADLETRFGDRLIFAGRSPLDPAALAALLRVGNRYLSGPTAGDRLARDLALHLGLPVQDAAAFPATKQRRVDGLAFADALAGVLELSCHELARAGRFAFQSEREPLSAPDLACDFGTRHTTGQHLLALGRPDRAVLYLLAAIEAPQAGAEVWHDLALALHGNHQVTDAIQALETSVRLAPGRLDSWLLLSDWAADYGHVELLQEILGIVQTLAPADPRVTDLAARLAS